MRIGINTRFLIASKMEGFGRFTYEITKRMVEAHPEHEFIFFFDRPYDPQFVFSNNVIPVVLSPSARHPVLFLIWFEFALKRAMKKLEVDVLFSPDGYLSLRSEITQIAVIHDINFEHYPEDIPWGIRYYLKHFFPRFARKANAIITVSEYSKQDIANTYQIDPEKIHVTCNAAGELYKPLHYEEIQTIRFNLTSGNPYFLFVGSLHPRKNVKRLIEAFTIFKNKTQSKVKLVIVGDYMWNKRAHALHIPEDLASDIHFTGHLDANNLAKLVGAATALTYVPYFEGFGIPLVEAMKCGTPILSGDRTSLPEVAGDAAIYCNPFDTSDIAAKMEELAGSESLQKNLSELGLKRSQLFNWDQSAAICWGVIEHTFNVDNN